MEGAWIKPNRPQYESNKVSIGRQPGYEHERPRGDEDAGSNEDTQGRERTWQQTTKATRKLQTPNHVEKEYVQYLEGTKNGIDGDKQDVTPLSREHGIERLAEWTHQ